LHQIYPQAIFEEFDGALVLSARDNDLVRRQRLDRKLAAVILGEVDKKGTTSLDDLARWSASPESEPSLLLLAEFIRFLGARSAYPSISWKLLHIYGQLTEEQRRQSRSLEGVRLQVGNGTSVLTNAVRSILSDRASEANPPSAPWDERLSEDSTPEHQERDPNWVFAEGLPVGSSLLIQVVEKNNIYMSQRRNGNLTTPNQISEWMLAMEMRSPHLGQDVVFAVVPVLELRIMIRGGEKGVVMRKGTHPLLSQEVQFVPAEKLPAELLERIKSKN